ADLWSCQVLDALLRGQDPEEPRRDRDVHPPPPQARGRETHTQAPGVRRRLLPCGRDEANVRSCPNALPFTRPTSRPTRRCRHRTEPLLKSRSLPEVRWHDDTGL